MPKRQNYLEKLDQKKKEKISSGLVSERFPQVSEMVIHITYYHKAVEQVLMERTINFYPSSYAYFNVECMNNSCENGGFELTKVIRDMVKNHKKALKGKLTCSGNSKILSPDHASISYSININYSRKS